jgi:hypothetical protein
MKGTYAQDNLWGQYRTRTVRGNQIQIPKVWGISS